ncbi:MAG: hypothetical protein RLZZ574_2625, partial [Cyanobacteriota bacterium]
MSKNILLENIVSIEGYFTLPERVHELEKNIVECEKLGSIYQYNDKSNLDSALLADSDNQNDYLAMAINNNSEISTGTDNDVIYGKAISSALSSATASAGTEFIADYLVIADSQANADAGVLALGLVNLGKINTGRGDDIIFGTADASGNSTTDSQAELVLSNVTYTDATSSSMATVNVVVDAVGISNAGKINTGL